MTRAHDAEEVASGDDLLAQIRNLHTRTLAVLGQAESTGDARTVLLAVREARTNLELLARLLGDLREAQTVNLLVQPEWYRVRSILIEALLPYPDARAAVSRVLLAVGPA